MTVTFFDFELVTIDGLPQAQPAETVPLARYLRGNPIQ